MLLLWALWLNSALAQETTIYRGFAEFKHPVTLPPNAWAWEPGVTLFQNLVPGTLRILGVTELSRGIEAGETVDPLQAYKGRTVLFYWEGRWREAEVVDPGRNLFKYEGKYLAGLPGIIAYPDLAGFSPAIGPRIVFYYQGSGPAVLSYLARGLSWNLSYTLEDGDLAGWASLENSLGKPLKLGKTTLVAGVVPLALGAYAPVPRISSKALGLSVPASAPDMAEYQGESGGVYRYRLPGEVSLQPGITELPFVRSKLKPSYYWSYQGGFNTAPEIWFERGYRFSAPENLAGGVVSVRDGGVFVGQAVMQDTAKGTLAKLSLGRDPEGRAERKAELLSGNKYRVSTVVRNSKTYPVEVELYETFPQPFTLQFDGADRVPEGYRIKFVLTPGESRTLIYTVTLEQR